MEVGGSAADPLRRPSRKLHWVVIAQQHPRIEIILKGHEGDRMVDNLTIDRRGRILMQEDVGNNARLGKIWLSGADTGELIEVAAHNPSFFTAGEDQFITADEESSGIIDAAGILGKGWFLLDVQAHKASADQELVESGQLLAMWVHPALGVLYEDIDDDGDDDGKDEGDDNDGDE